MDDVKNDKALNLIRANARLHPNTSNKETNNEIQENMEINPKRVCYAHWGTGTSNTSQEAKSQYNFLFYLLYGGWRIGQVNLRERRGFTEKINQREQEKTAG